MNGRTQESKSEIRARIQELESFLGSKVVSKTLLGTRIQKRINVLKKKLDRAQEDLSASIIESHVAICKAKQMGEKEAYGNDPAVYYTLGVCGEAGEMANAIVKAQRNGVNKKKILDAVCSELPDVIIYSYVLAHVLDIDLSKLVNKKVEVVIKRASDGYYGGPLKRRHPNKPKKL